MVTWSERPIYAVVRALYAVLSSLYSFASLCGSEPICLDSGLERKIFYISCLEHILILRSHVNIYMFCDGKFSQYI